MASFKARARTVDMLGRQQIAGIPTAISELFKNAHDAYADNAIVDYFRDSGLLVLRDDGIGMTKQDFEDRWLTLGTESQLKTEIGISKPAKDIDKPERPILGEKGIGRLAIASIGSQVLILTKAKRNEIIHDLVVSYVNWKLFELPGIDLNDVVIPLRVFPNGTIPTADDISNMTSEVLDSILKLYNNNKILKDDYDELCNDLSNFKVNPSNFYSISDKPQLTEGEHGTHFFVMSDKENLELVIDGDKSNDKTTPLMKSLLGFTNSMNGSPDKTYLHTKFRDHKSIDYCEDIINENNFWLPDEFEMADHLIEGQFDEFGQFRGIVRVYDKNIDHIIPWTKGNNRTTLCGPFNIKFGYVVGRIRQSSLDPEVFAFLSAKLEKISGLYIYKDNIRILPYGDSDYDFLEIEKRRTKSAGYYFFSYRRLFGTIEISGEKNKNLVEKAGREGFRQNKAYSQFKSILENLFLQLAADLFREPGEDDNSFNLTYFSQKRDEFVRLHKAKVATEKKSREKRRIFEKGLDLIFERIEQKEPQEMIEALLKKTRAEFIVVENLEKDPDEFVNSFIIAEREAYKKLDAIIAEFKLTKPRGVGLNKEIRRDWDFYQDLNTELSEGLFSYAKSEINKIANQTGESHSKLLNKQKRFKTAVEQKFNDTKKLSLSESKETKNKFDEVNSNVSNLIRELNFDIVKSIRELKSEIERTNFLDFDDVELMKKKDYYEFQLSEKFDASKKILEDIRIQLDNVDLKKSDDGEYITSTDEREAMENELIALRDQVELDLELSQLGNAVSIIHHEFSHTIISLRRCMGSLKSWADFNDDLVPLYQDIIYNFEHLDGYLTLFTPLNRRLYRKKIDLRGSEIYKYTDDVFKERLRRHDIKLQHTSKFMQKSMNCYPSSILPAFINIVDNAIFWLSRSSGSKLILLDADENSFYISNNGEPILKRDIQSKSIFEDGFTRKPGGRGMGLHISKQVLNKENYDLTIDERPNMNVTFKISERRMEE